MPDCARPIMSYKCNPVQERQTAAGRQLFNSQSPNIHTQSLDINDGSTNRNKLCIDISPAVVCSPTKLCARFHCSTIHPRLQTTHRTAVLQFPFLTIAPSSNGTS